MTRTRTGCFNVLAMIVLLGSASAQQLPQLTPGQRVRVTLAALNATTAVGQLLSRGDSSLLLLLDSVQTMRLRLGDVRRVEVSRGMRSGARAGAWAGGLVGLVGGLAVGIATRPHGPSCHSSGSGWLRLPDLDFRCLETIGKTVGWVTLTGVAGGLSGAGLGALIGHGFHGERWEQVPLDRLRVAIVPEPGGRLGLGATLAF